MDRNTILAIALAMLVLTFYQSVFVAPKKAQMLKTSQVVQNKEDIVKSAASIPNLAKEEQKPTSTNLKEEITTLETPIIGLEFSNMGGSLHKVIYNRNESIFPLENMLIVKGFENVPFVLSSKDEKAIVYKYADQDRSIVKSFTIKDKNSLTATISIKNLNQNSRLENIQIKTINISAPPTDPKNSRNTMLDEASVLENNKVIRKGNAYKFNAKDNKVGVGQIGWAGYREHYHAFLIKPEFETKGYESEVLGENKYAVNINPKDQPTSVGQTMTYDFTIVVGNQDIGWLKSYHKDLEKIVAFSSFFPIDICAKAVYYTIPILHSICRSWGISIVLISLIIYGITYPLTMKSMSSMRKMQLVQPKVAALQKRYKTDPQKLNAEMVQLYKAEGVNPLGGCLPFILQMPVFMALYQALWRAYYFQGQGFLWIKDLALPDRLFILPFNLPFLGNEFNILPIVMGAVMFLQQSVSAKNMVVTDEQQAMQQKMMRYIFPFFIGFIFYKFASGLSLYFTVFYALSTWTQWKIAQPAVATAKIK